MQASLTFESSVSVLGTGWLFPPRHRSLCASWGVGGTELSSCRSEIFVQIIEVEAGQHLDLDH